jgi:hypothetical protein
VIPTPLTRLVWWRVAADEAQLVGGTSAKAAELAGQLGAVHRWAVTGGAGDRRRCRQGGLQGGAGQQGAEVCCAFRRVV